VTRAYISIGSNIDRESNIRSGIRTLRERHGELVISPIYDNPAVGFEGGRFYNLVVGLDTDVEAGPLAAELREIERDHGRRPGIPKYSSRTLDLDLLTWGERVFQSEGLKLPRPEILRFAFVLRPLADIAGNTRHPLDGRTFSEIWAAFDDSGESLTPVSVDLD
jgi:2-amino-4-hydroxy-6-hydroxymethyldihydropteridine diphosphokinase